MVIKTADVNDVWMFLTVDCGALAKILFCPRETFILVNNVVMRRRWQQWRYVSVQTKIICPRCFPLTKTVHFLLFDWLEATASSECS